MKQGDPSWWLFGRDDDRQWALDFLEKFRTGADISANELVFYLAAIERLAKDEYPKAAHRPKEPINFWIALRYELRVQSGIAGKRAASETAELAAVSSSTVQSHARTWRQEVGSYVSASWDRLPQDLRAGVTESDHRESLIKFADRQISSQRDRRKKASARGRKKSRSS